MAEPKDLVAACGLYCGACGSYKKGKCPGCSENTKATWCKIRTCCKETNCKSCADCVHFDYIDKCAKFNNFPSKVISFFTGSDRHACIHRIREIGYAKYAIEMEVKKAVAINKKNRDIPSVWDKPEFKDK